MSDEVMAIAGMSVDNLPSGWIIATLADLAANRSGNSKLIKGKQSDTPSKAFPYPGFSASGQDVWLSTYDHEGRAIIISAVGARCGKAFEANGKWSAIANTHIVRPNESVLDMKLFWYLINDENFWVRGGSAQPFVKVNKTFERLFPLAPLAEQKRIADKLEAVLGRVDACRARLDRVPALLKRFRQSVLAAAMSGRLTDEWRQSHESPSMKSILAALSSTAKLRRGVLDSSHNVPEPLVVWGVPATWVKATAGTLIAKGVILDLKDGNHGANHPIVSDFTPNGLPFITAAQVRDYKIDYDDAYKISGPPLAKLRVGFAKPDDVILTHKGSVGRVGIADRDCILTPQTTYYRLDSKWLLPKFQMFFLSSPAFSNQLDEIKSQTTRDFVPITQQYSLGHLLPPLAEQQEIVRRVEALFAFADRIEARLATLQKTVERLTPATLAKAFRGELVPQDPNDEPASTLLERINATKEAGPAKSKTKTRLTSKC